MKVQQTLALIKPDAVRKKAIGKILARYEEAGFAVVAMRMVQLTQREAQFFYDVHRGKPFFDSLTTFMSSGPIVAIVLQGEDIISRNRVLMGSTNPKEAAPGTIRKDFATDIEKNAVHGSDAPETAQKEISFFFSQLDSLRSGM